MAGPTGLGSNNPLTKTKKRNTMLSTVVRRTHGLDWVEVGVEELIPNPDNPASRQAPDADLQASVETVGLLQPLVAQSRAVYLKEHPEFTETLPEGSWVLLIGHRRRLAAKAAGLATVPVVVRDDLDSDLALLVENSLREGLRPIEDAEALRRLLRRLGSQRAVAEAVSRSTAAVSKRLKLLELPVELHERVDSAELSLEDAPKVVATLGRHPDAAEQLVRSLSDRKYSSVELVRLADEAVRTVEKAERDEAAAAVAQEQGVPLVKDRFRSVDGAVPTVLTTDEEVQTARDEGTLAVAPAASAGEGPAVFVSLDQAQGSAAEVAQKAKDKERLAARRARREFVAGLVAKKSLGHRSLGVLPVQATLAGLGLDAECARLARRWAAEAKVGPVSESDWEWREAVAALPLSDSVSEKVAGIVILASLEVEVSHPHARWGQVAAVFLDWLRANGYVLSAWEEAQLSNDDNGKGF